MSIPLDIVQDKDVAGTARECLDRALEVHVCIGCDDRCSNVVHGDVRVAPCATNALAADIHQHPAEPRAQGRVRAKRRQRAHGARPTLLHEVFRFAGVAARKAECECVERAGVRAVERAKRPFAPGLEKKANQRRIVNGGWRVGHGAGAGSMNVRTTVMMFEYGVPGLSTMGPRMSIGPGTSPRSDERRNGV